MQRYFTDKQLSPGENHQVESSDFHHMKNVMRFQEDDTFEIVDVNRKLFLCSVIDVNQSIAYQVVSEEMTDTELPLKVTIVCPLLKGEKFDWMIQKSTELGADEFIIYEADRSIVKLDGKKRNKRLERYEKIIKEASEQSKRLKIPEIKFSGKLETVSFERASDVFFAFEGLAGDASKSLKNYTDFKDKNQISFIFGPEGGFSEQEVKTAENFTKIRLGTRILRAETAPLYFLAAVSLIMD